MHTVVGMFDNAAQAQQAAQQLQSAGFGLDNVDVARGGAAGVSGAADRAGDSLSQASRPDRDPSDYRNSSGTMTEGAADAAGRTGDSIGSFFSNLFGGDTSDDAQRYSHVGRQAGSIVTVHCESAERAHAAAQILDRAGAIDVDERAAQSGYQSSNWTGAAGAQSLNNQDVTGRGVDATTGQSINVIEENLQIGKREVETGGARLRSRIVERPVEEHLRLREEHVWIQRNPVNRPASEADIQSFREGQIEITEHAEVPVVNKEARVVEEIRMGKEIEERDEVIRDTVRKTEVDVDRFGGDQSNRLDPDLDDEQRRRS